MSDVQPEPVSPELVLVDPELARRERARLEEKAFLQDLRRTVAVAAPVAVPPAEEPARRPLSWRLAADVSRRRLLPAALMCSLLANGFLVAKLLTREGPQSASPVAIRIVPSTGATVVAPSVKPPGTTTVPDVTKGSVERRLASLVVSAPAHKLPQRFVDPTTGLARNNVQVVCDKTGRRVFLCAVRLAGDANELALYVRYRTTADGNGSFTWYGLKRAAPR